MQSENQQNSGLTCEPPHNPYHGPQVDGQTNPALENVHTSTTNREFRFLNETPIFTCSTPSTPDGTRRKVGRPRGSTKQAHPAAIPVVYGPKRRRGRPPGSKRKRSEGDEGEDLDMEIGQPPAAKELKRGPGRPRRNEAFRVTVTQLNGPIRQQGWVSASAQRIAAANVVSQTPQVAHTGAQIVQDNSAGSSGSVSTPSSQVPPTATHLPSGLHPLPLLSQTTSPVCLLPGEDPQQYVTSNQELLEDDGEEEDIDNGCLEEQAVGEGIGVDEDFVREEDEVSDPAEPVVGEAPARKSPPIQAWLLNRVNQCLQQIQNRNQHGAPQKYHEEHTIWFESPSPSLLLKYCQPSPILLYTPRICVWDPLAITPIPCPFCKRPLTRHGQIPRPRRIVDVDTTFWIVGFRYHCANCRHPTSRLRTVTFQSWDSRILQLLPPDISEDFPARFSSRSGISTTLFELMRCSFQSGMGAKQFADGIVVMHLARYDKLRRQYYQSLTQWLIARHIGIRFPAFPPYDDTGPMGYHGYVPCASWFRTMYDQFIEEHANDIFQHTAMLPLNIGALDHSHKITKHISRVNGERVFAGLLTVTNENGEIRASHLVTTTGHSQSELSLSNLSQSLTLYGHNQPQVFYTDNVQGDKRLLETVFKSSLTKDVVAVEEYAHLEELQIPDHVTISVENTATAINTICQAIMDDMPQDGDNSVLVIGFDSEWNVEISANDRLRHRGSTAIIQIAYKDAVYIFQISNMLSGHHFPNQLKVLLENPKILKAGRLIDGDLKSLQTACRSTKPFVGGIDLAKLAKQRCVLENIRTTSLADLCARVLHKRINKNTSERISSAWGDRILTPEQIKYASLDVYASLQIYSKLNSLSIPAFIDHIPNPNSLANMPVMLYSQDKHTLIASGIILWPSPIVDLPPGTQMVEVHEVLRPAAKISVVGYEMSLADFGTPPFCLPHLSSRLITYTPLAKPPSPPHNSLPNLRQQLFSHPQPITRIPDDVTNDFNPEPPEGYSSDPASAAEGAQALGEIPTVWPTLIRSRVVKDVFHMMNMFNTSVRHGLHTEFKRALRDAVLLLDRDDANRIITWGASQNPPITLDNLRKYRPRWLWKRCKRFIPPPEILYLRVFKVLQAFGPLKDATSGVPLFNSASWKMARNVLDLIYRGELSDPGDVPLYTAIGLDKKTGLPLYRCLRGTNSTEGGVHTYLRPHLPTSGSSIRHVDATLLDFTLHHNLIVGTRNTTGKPYRGHFSIWLTNEIQQLVIYLKDILYNPDNAITSSSPPWINGNFYKPTSEVPIGVLPIPQTIRKANGLSPYNSTFDKSRPHSFLAKLQGTRKAILPVHTPVERALFRKLMQRRRPSTTSNGPGTSRRPDPESSESLESIELDTRNCDTASWAQMVRTWNGLADLNDQVFYKLSEQLQQYFSHWKTSVNVKETLALTTQARHPLIEQLTDLRILSNAPPVRQRSLQPHTVSSGLLPAQPDANLDAPVQAISQTITTATISTPSLSETPPAYSNQSDSLPVLAHSSSRHVIPPPTANSTTLPTTPLNPDLGLNRVAPVNEQPEQLDVSRAHSIAQNQFLSAQHVRQVVPKGPKIRHCMKCSSAQCPGKARRNYCKAVCQDCHSPSCQGRNAKRPDKKCTEAWI